MRFNKEKIKYYSWLFSGLGTTIGIALIEYLKINPGNIIGSILIGLFIIFAYTLFIKIVKFLRKKNFFIYLKSKVKEIFYLLLDENKIYIKSQDKYNVFSLNKELLRLSLGLNDFICYNQGAYANYSFVASRIHKKMKEELNKEDKNNHQIKTHVMELKNHLHYNFINICENNYNKFIKKYFKGRSNFNVRMTIKGCTKENKIVDFFRLQDEYFTNYQPEENSGFLHVNDRGSYYICNNIPEAAANDKYINPRLQNEKVRLYLQDLKKHDKHNDFERWMDCWIRNKKGEEIIPPPPDSCYKSTLIIPITLVNNEGLSDEFRTHFEIPNAPRSSDEIARAVYGLLCFDHREENYFIEELDVKIAYIYADIFSLYIVDLLNYMDYSCSFNEVLDLFPNIKEIFT